MCVSANMCLFVSLYVCMCESICVYVCIFKKQKPKGLEMSAESVKQLVDCMCKKDELISQLCAQLKTKETQMVYICEYVRMCECSYVLCFEL